MKERTVFVGGDLHILSISTVQTKKMSRAPGFLWETKLSLMILLILSSKRLPSIFLTPKGGLKGPS